MSIHICPKLWSTHPRIICFFTLTFPKLTNELPVPYLGLTNLRSSWLLFNLSEHSPLPLGSDFLFLNYQTPFQLSVQQKALEMPESPRPQSQPLLTQALLGWTVCGMALCYTTFFYFLHGTAISGLLCWFLFYESWASTGPGFCERGLVPFSTSNTC